MPMHKDVVYYILFRPSIKIGTTTHLARRINELLCDELLAIEFGGRQKENERHAQFAALRESGEWFKADSLLLDHTAGLKENSKNDSDIIELLYRITCSFKYSEPVREFYSSITGIPR